MPFHSRLAGGGLYVQQLIITLPETVDADALRQAWQLVADRHAALRTAFPADCTQIVADEIDLEFEELDWTADVDDWLAADRRLGFDFAMPPLWRVTLLRRGPNDFVFVWTFHHALLDGRSHRLVLEEAFAAYEAFRDGNEPSLPPTRPFGEFVDWLQQQDTVAAEKYWRGVLAGVETPTSLNHLASSVRAGSVSDGPLQPSLTLPARTRTDGGEQVLVLPEQTTAALKAFAAENDVTPTTLVQAAWAVLLARYSGETGVVFGGTRRLPSEPPGSSRRSVGLRINTLPVRANVVATRRSSTCSPGCGRNGSPAASSTHAAPVDVQSWAGLPGGTPLYETIVVAENYDLNESLRDRGGAWAKRSVRCSKRRIIRWR